MKTLRFFVAVYEVVNDKGNVIYRGPKDGAEFAAKTFGGTIRQQQHPAKKTQLAAFLASEASIC